ncbi:MAG: trigger factor [Oscillospiraceae bacterium]
MNIRKFLCIVLALTLIVGTLAGCSGSKGEDVPDDDSSADQPQEDGTGDQDNGNEDNSDNTDSSSETVLSSYSDGLTDQGFFEGVTASDIVTLPDYKGISIPASTLTASEDDIQAEIDSILSNYTSYEQVTDRAIVDGDTVNIDYVGSIDGVEFEGGSTQGAGTNVTIGVTQYIDDFLEQLIGHTPGENFDIEVTFPDPYENNPDLAGKDAVFNITVNYIRGDLIEQEFNDQVAADNGYSSADEFRKAIEDSIITSQKANFINNLLAQAVCEDVPESVMDFLINVELNTINIYASYYGLSSNEFISMVYGYATTDEYIEASTEEFKELASMYLAVQAIAELEGLEVTVDDIAAAGYEQYADYYGEEYIKQTLLWDQIIPDFIIGNAVIDNA